ncbi:MAG TPA: metal-sensitive transcriptional regulator [Aggregatilineales bacterium]|nr:metal-sensitive transcriptional regulator [Aggregatilineales bacterium]
MTQQAMPAATRHRERPDEFKQGVVNRLRSAAGHLNGISRMVDEDAYCIDVIHQVQAVQAALDKVALMVLDDHMRHCVMGAAESGDPAERERVLGELHDVFETLSKLKK